MEKKEQKSPHGWFIILLIVFTLCIFLLTMVFTMEQENVMVVRKLNKEAMMEQRQDLKHNNPNKKPMLLRMMTSTSTSPPPTAFKIIRDGKTLHHHDKTDLLNESLKRHLRSLPAVVGLKEAHEEDVVKAYSEKTVSLFLHGYEISTFSVGKNFYIYDCNISTTPDYLVVTILMELPEIKVVFQDHPEYSQYCPTINPYVHVVELVYIWGYDKTSMETDDFMTLSNLKIYMVSWEDNLYRKAFEQVKNSPLYNVEVPYPLNLSKEDLYDFLTKSNIFDNIAMAFTPPVTLRSIQNNTPI